MPGNSLFSKPNRDQVIALAGLYQACQLVESMARSGKVDDFHLETSIASLFVQNPETTEQVFGSAANLQEAIRQLRSSLSGQVNPQGAEILRYMMGVNYLAHKLQRNKAMLSRIGKRLEEIQFQRQHFSTLHENIITNLADLYVETIGTFQRRIQVNGFAQNLQQPLIAAKIRCLLFAAIRAAILWHQLGGGKSQFFLQRKAILSHLNQLLA